MEQILENNGLKLIKKYDRYYIRFMGGQDKNRICDLNITNKEAMMIVADHDEIQKVFDSYAQKGEWSDDFFTDNMIKEHMFYEANMSEKRIDQNMEKINRHQDIKLELCSAIAAGEFPSNGAISVCGYTAQKLKETTTLTVLGAYNYLIYLREDEKNALYYLKKGLPRK